MDRPTDKLMHSQIDDTHGKERFSTKLVKDVIRLANSLALLK